MSARMGNVAEALIDAIDGGKMVRSKEEDDKILQDFNTDRRETTIWEQGNEAQKNQVQFPRFRVAQGPEFKLG